MENRKQMDDAFISLAGAAIRVGMARYSPLDLDCFEGRLIVNELLKFRDEIQGMCFYWKSHYVHGYCQQANGMDHVCCFCELVEKLDVSMNKIKLEILNEVSVRYLDKGYREPEILTSLKAQLT